MVCSLRPAMGRIGSLVGTVWMGLCGRRGGLKLVRPTSWCCTGGRNKVRIPKQVGSAASGSLPLVKVLVYTTAVCAYIDLLESRKVFQFCS